MNEEQFIKRVETLGIKITDREISMLNKYCEFLQSYNEHTNLTAIKEKEQIYLKHFYDSLCLTQTIDFNKISSLIDIGTGAGFPGIIIKIFFPNVKVTLLDSNNKKTKFLEQVADLLKLTDVIIINARAEEYAEKHLNEYDVCTARAVAYADIITELALPFIKKDGCVLLLKGNNEKEFSFLESHKNDLNIKSIVLSNYSIIESEARYIIKIQKKEKTTKVLNYSQILKRNKKWTN